MRLGGVGDGDFELFAAGVEVVPGFADGVDGEVC